MYTISNFCHLCLNDDKCLIDLAETTPENEAFRTKLRFCISEVKWTSKHLLVCNLCAQKLEMVSNFKQTCIKSTHTLQNYLATLRGKKKLKSVKAKLHVPLSKEYINSDMINKYINSQTKVQKQGMLGKMLDQTVYAPTTSFILTNGQQVSYQNIFLNFVSTPTSANHVFMKTRNEEVSSNISSLSDNDAILKQLLETKSPEQLDVEIDPNLYNFEHFLIPKPNPTPNIECCTCLKSFTTIKMLRQHFDEAHDGDLPFLCTFCFSKFLLKEHYDKHMKNHRDKSGDTLIGSTVTLDNLSKCANPRVCGNNIQIELKCSFCSQICDTATSLAKHEYKIHGKPIERKQYSKSTKSTTCDMCLGEFSAEFNLQKHQLQCSKKSKHKSPSFEKDAHTIHEISEDDEVINPGPINIDEKSGGKLDKKPDDKVDGKIYGKLDEKTDDKFANENVENNNMDANNEKVDNENSLNTCGNDTMLNAVITESEDGKPVCNICNKTFGRRHDLKRHINNLHVKSIHYICHLCDEKFYEGFHLTRHLRSHYSSLSCSECHHMFASVSEITNHMLATHKQLKFVDCNVCFVSFDNMANLKEHINQHLLDIVYKCHICETKFQECRELTRHVSEHNGIKSCENCNQVYYKEEEFIEHKKVCVEETHKCDICPKIFKKKRYLHAHTKARHAKEMSTDEPQKKKTKIDEI